MYHSGINKLAFCIHYFSLLISITVFCHLKLKRNAGFQHIIGNLATKLLIPNRELYKRIQNIS